MKNFIKVTCDNKKVLRMNVNAISFYEPIQKANGEVDGTRIYNINWADSLKVFETPEEIDDLIEKAQEDAIEYRYGGGEIA